MNHLDGMGHHPEIHSVSPSYSVSFPLTGQNPYYQSFEAFSKFKIQIKQLGNKQEASIAWSE